MTEAIVEARSVSLIDQRALAAYLVQLRPLLKAAAEVRRALVARLGELMQDAQTRPPEMVAGSLPSAGIDHQAALVHLREEVERLTRPAMAEACHGDVILWIEKQEAACADLVALASNPLATSDRSELLRGLQRVQRLIATGREDQRRFTAEYERLVVWLRAQAAARKATRRVGLRWLRRRQAVPA